jgi:hypothetical protein
MEVEGRHHEPRRGGRDQPGDDRPGKAEGCDAHVSDACEAAPQCLARRADARRTYAHEPQRTKQHDEWALAVASEQHAENRDTHCEDRAERPRCAQPADVRQPREQDEQHQQEAEHVEDPLDDDRPRRLGARRSGSPVKVKRARDLAAACREDAVEEEAE